MTNKEREELIHALDAKAEIYSNSREESKKFLIRIGVINKKGKLTEPYKHLCIPQDQD